MLVDSPFDGKAVEFDGVDDRLVVSQNPIVGAEEFTIEAIIYPNDVHPKNKEPRFFHIESSSNKDRRITMELRLNSKSQWYLDTYIKSDNDRFTLVDKSLVHPTNEWFHTAITYKDKTFTAYVNGIEELSAKVEYQPIPADAKSSIGARMNEVHWFNGSIYSVTSTPKALDPSAFRTLNLIP